jgi:hypothetical protein
MQDLIRINGNHFIDNSATFGGGINSASPQARPVIYDNVFINNSASKATGLIVWGESTISKNHFQNHQGQEVIFWAVPQGTFERNTIVGNNTNTGLSLYMGSPPFPRFSNNIIVGSGTNALVAGGPQQNPLFAELEHNTLVGGGGGAAVSIPANNYVTLSLTNNIITGFPVGVENNSPPPASTVTARYTLFAPDVSNHGINANFTNSLVGDPAFKNPAAADYHIRFSSAARDAGASGVVATQDIDGDPRPIGSAPDIGADEYKDAAYLYLPLINQ